MSIHLHSIILLYLIVTVLIFAVTPPGYYGCNPQQADFLCILSGVLFLLIGSCWPIAYCWKRRPSRNFIMLGCYLWLLSVLIVSCLAALGATMVAANCSDPLSLIVVITMGAVVVTFLCSSVCCLCFFSRKIGRIC